MFFASILFVHVKIRSMSLVSSFLIQTYPIMSAPVISTIPTGIIIYNARRPSDNLVVGTVNDKAVELNNVEIPVQL